MLTQINGERYAFPTLLSSPTHVPALPRYGQTLAVRRDRHFTADLLE
ncbi:MAG: hypothetical protein LBI16_02080 [Burkholderiales bacterium]|nr:hypothetical protein [Burkholderiales bacterium]